ncbi:MAG: HipA domain-containing protein [Flavobacteriales bacterium]|nr:HipA domain-containing protein [Flavobacteriales bacterium]
MQNICLYCYKTIEQSENNVEVPISDYHEKCSTIFFGKKTPPVLNFTQDEIIKLAEQVIKSHTTVTGVQPKLALGIDKKAGNTERLTIVGLWGEYILKPQTELYAQLPENEDLTMHLAEISRIKTVKHCLIKLKSGELAYITKRIDRSKKEKNHMEDMCQLTERLTEHKYNGSHEQIVKAIKKYSANPGLDVTNFFELVMFCFLTGNNDMHLKNFSLLKLKDEYALCPAYDLVSSELIFDQDDEDLALNLNGKKKKINRIDFEIAMKGSNIDQKVINNVFNKFQELLPKWFLFIDKSFLPGKLKEEYKNLISRKAIQIEIITSPSRVGKGESHP